MTLQFDTMIDVEPRHGVAHNIFNVLLNKLLQVENASSKKNPLKGGLFSSYTRISMLSEVCNFAFFFFDLEILTFRRSLETSPSIMIFKTFLKSFNGGLMQRLQRTKLFNFYFAPFAIA